MVTKVIGFNLTKYDREQIGKILAWQGFVPGIGNTDTLDVIDVRTSTVSIEGADLVIAFGERAARKVEDLVKEKFLLYLVLPTVKKLYPLEQGGEDEARTEAAQKLQNLKSQLTGATADKIVEDKKLLQSLQVNTLPDLSLAQIQLLEKKLVESGKECWYCRLRDGNIARISVKQQKPTSDVNISITFSELFTIRSAMDVLKTTEIEFVPAETTTAVDKKVSSTANTNK